MWTKVKESKGNYANRSIRANSSLDSEPVPPMSFMVNISMDFSSEDPDLEHDSLKPLLWLKLYI